MAGKSSRLNPHRYAQHRPGRRERFLAAVFTHRDSRARDPDLHTHVAVANKVQSLVGDWLALNVRTLHRMAAVGSERYNTPLEAGVIRRALDDMIAGLRTGSEVPRSHLR